MHMADKVIGIQAKADYTGDYYLKSTLTRHERPASLRYFGGYDFIVWFEASSWI